MSNPKTIRVKIAVSVDPNGDWCAFGWPGAKPDELHGSTLDALNPGERRYWIEADLEVPAVDTIQGETSDA